MASKSFVLVVAAAVVLTLGLAPAASAKQVRVKTNTSAKAEPTGVPGQAKYSGKVTCKPPKGDSAEERERNRDLANGCEKGRAVNVYHGDFFIGSGTTNKDGEWEVIGNKPPAGDSVRIEVAQDKFGKANCRPKTKSLVVSF